MITVTFKLRDLEAEALERLAYVYGVSENRLVNTLISWEYDNFVSTGPATVPPDYALTEISQEKDFPDEYLETFITSPEKISPANIRRIIKCYDYALEHVEGPSVEELGAARYKWLIALKEREDSDYLGSAFDR